MQLLMGTIRHDQGAMLVDTYGNEEFSRDVIETFAVLRDELTYDTNLLHPQMGTLAAAVREALAAGDLASALQICAFLDAVLNKPSAISEIENAVAISFVESSELCATRMGRLLMERMPDRVRSILLAQGKRSGAQ